MIKFEHSIFALPFALTGALLAYREDGFATPNLVQKVLYIILAMVGARSAAMTFNRLLDQQIDGRNPRTKNRQLPAGTLSRSFAWGFFLLTSAVFFVAAWALNPLCLQLAPLALGVVCFYSYTKRFTSFAHLVLGFALGIAPAAAWIAMRGSLDWRMLWLTAAVHVLDCRFRRHLLVSGLRIRPARRAVLSPQPLRHRRRALDCTTAPHRDVDFDRRAHPILRTWLACLGGRSGCRSHAHV